MRIILNGAEQEIADGATIADLLAQTHPDATAQRGVAVAVDRQVVPRSTWTEAVLAEGAKVEFVTAVQGG